MTRLPPIEKQTLRVVTRRASIAQRPTGAGHG